MPKVYGAAADPYVNNKPKPWKAPERPKFDSNKYKIVARKGADGTLYNQRIDKEGREVFAVGEDPYVTYTSKKAR